jgi:tRNA G18 (ribose-2'-O)-methylase SpoU
MPIRPKGSQLVPGRKKLQGCPDRMHQVGILHIGDLSDTRLTAYRNVSDPDLLVRHGLFVAEGRLVVRRLLQQRQQLIIQSVLVTQTALVPLRDLLAPEESLPIYVVPQELMNAIAGFNVHRGCLAVAERPRPRPWRHIARDARRLVVLERVGNADNVGSVFRNAGAFGVDAVLLESGCADPLYRKAIRTSMAASLTLPFATAEPWPTMLEQLRAEGWAVVAMTPRARSRELRAVVRDIGGGPTALVMGHEGEGLTAEALDACSHHARIAIANDVDSLNVATATAIGLYELSQASGIRPQGSGPGKD